MDELKMQARLVKTVNMKKGWGIKMASRHTGGVPDLFLKLHTLPGVFIECKKDKLSLTALQKDVLKRLHKANMPAGWLVYQQEGAVFNFFVGASPDANTLEPGQNCWMIPTSGKIWEAGEIIAAIVHWASIEQDKLG